MTLLWINVLLTIPFIALWVGIPVWLVLKHPDAGPAVTAVRVLTPRPGWRDDDAGYRRVA